MENNLILFLGYNTDLMMNVTFAGSLKYIELLFSFNCWKNSKITRFNEITLNSFTNIIYQRNAWIYEQMSRDFYGEVVNKIFSTVNSVSIK